MPPVDERYPALVERALRLIEQRGEPVEAAELARTLFGASHGPWTTLLGRVLAADRRLRCLADGRWARSTDLPIAREAPSIYDAGRPVAVASSPRDVAAGPADETAVGSTGPRSAVGLVVLATGPKPWRHPIVALGAARRQANGTLERFETLVRPMEPCRIPAYLARLGVSAEALDEAPSPERALDALLAFVGEAPLAGLDVGPAVARIQLALRALGWPPLSNDLIELAVPTETRPDLARLAGRVGLPVPNRLGPAVLAALAVQLAERRGNLSSASGALGATAWRRLLDARALTAVPDAPGIYRFIGADQRLLYVGKATSLRARLASYLNGQFPLVRQMPGLIEATEQLQQEVTTCELAARIREAELIAAARPPYNVQRRAGPVLTRVRLVMRGEVDARGVNVPRLVLATGQGFLTTDRAAQAALRAARAAWWPRRPRAAARPAPELIGARFNAVVAAFEAEIAAAPVGPGLRALDLAGGLLVVAPVRPLRGVAPTALDPFEAEDGWTREVRDTEWPPPDLMMWWDDTTAIASNHEVAAIASREPPVAARTADDGGAHLAVVDSRRRAGALTANDVVALWVDSTGLRAAVPVRGQSDASREEAQAAVEAATPMSGHGGGAEAALAGLAVVLAALTRGEAGVRAWPALAADPLLRPDGDDAIVQNENGAAARQV